MLVPNVRQPRRKQSQVAGVGSLSVLAQAFFDPKAVLKGPDQGLISGTDLRQVHNRSRATSEPP
jgi:hypothetical protein